MKIEFIPIKTRVVRTPKDDIYDIIDSLDIREGDILLLLLRLWQYIKVELVELVVCKRNP